MSDMVIVGDTRHVGDVVGNIGIHGLFSDDFMKEYTKFSTFDKFLKATGLHIGSIDEIPCLLRPGVNELVGECTEFGSWSEMVTTACDFYIAQNMR